MAPNDTSKQLYPGYTATYHNAVYPTIDPAHGKLDFSGKIAFVTGGGRGIGRAISLAFAKASARGVILMGRTRECLEDTAEEIRRLANGNTEALIVTADITDANEVHRAFETTIEKFGVVPDVLVNNAGGGAADDIVDMDLNGFWRTFEVNTKGPAIVAQAFLQANKKHSPDTPRTLINIISAAGQLQYTPKLAGYAASKLATAKITEFLHHENMSWNVFNVHPGLVDTDLSRAAGVDAPDEPELPAGLCVWLSTRPEARFLSGRHVWANWDVNELLAMKDEIEKRDLLTITLKGWAEDFTSDELKYRTASAFAPVDKETSVSL